MKKNFFLLLLAFIAQLSFVSCSNDDNDSINNNGNNNPKELVVGSEWVNSERNYTIDVLSQDSLSFSFIAHSVPYTKNLKYHIEHSTIIIDDEFKFSAGPHGLITIVKNFKGEVKDGVIHSTLTTYSDKNANEEVTINLDFKLQEKDKTIDLAGTQWNNEDRGFSFDFKTKESVNMSVIEHKKLDKMFKYRIEGNKVYIDGDWSMPAGPHGTITFIKNFVGEIDQDKEIIHSKLTSYSDEEMSKEANIELDFTKVKEKK